MASITAPASPAENPQAWNEAYDRLTHFLHTFVLKDHSQTARLALLILDQAREIHRKDLSLDPATVTMEHAQKVLAVWLAANLEEEDETPSHILATGYIALLVSRISRTAPSAFLASPLPDDLRQLMRQTLLVTGPDLNISSMTPRHLDYGPMLHLARQTWHRFDKKSFFVALLFWAGVYVVFYWWLSESL